MEHLELKQAVQPQRGQLGDLVVPELQHLVRGRGRGRGMGLGGGGGRGRVG